MPEVKWIKITTTMFEDEKIDFIESLPECDAILIIWIKLLTLAGKCNAGGFIMLTESIPYTDDMLAHKFRRPLNTVKLALETLKKLGMITYVDNGICITNWEKHQNIEGMDKIREQTRKRVSGYRERQKMLSSNATGNATVTEGNATDIDKELDIDIEKYIIPYKDIIDYLNQKTNSSFKHTSTKNQDLIKARWNEGYRLEDFKKVIDIKTLDWNHDPPPGKEDMRQYLRPLTLFSNKFESYINQKVKEVKPIESPRTNPSGNTAVSIFRQNRSKFVSNG